MSKVCVSFKIILPIAWTYHAHLYLKGWRVKLKYIYIAKYWPLMGEMQSVITLGAGSKMRVVIILGESSHIE